MHESWFNAGFLVNTWSSSVITNCVRSFDLLVLYQVMNNILFYIFLCHQMRFVLHKMVHLGLISPKSEQCLLSQDIWSCNQTPSSNSKVLHGTARVKSPHILYVQHVGGSVLKKNNVQICYCYEKGQTLQIALKARRNGFLLLLWWHMWYKSKGKKKKKASGSCIH